MKFFPLIFIFCAVSMHLVPACIWDRDTLQTEGQNIPDVIKAISGRFDRFPPKYYEMRRDRVLQEIKTQPNDLNLYDDLAVCYDRLGDSTTAISWMAKKREQLDQLATKDAEHEYRYLANLGTFYAHRWLKAGKDLTKLEDIDKAIELIKAAIELNPEAHFGREKYQLLALQWIETLASDDAARSLATQMHIYYYENRSNAETDPNAKASEAVEGFSGLITLGAAWQSYDIFFALSVALQEDSRHAVAYLAQLRIQELSDSGKKSIAAHLTEVEPRKLDIIQSKQVATKYYQALRTEAKQWQADRLRYMESRFSEGKHPDTHKDFWQDYVEKTKPPKLPKRIREKSLFDILQLVGIVCASLLLAILLGTRFLSKSTANIRKPN